MTASTKALFVFAGAFLVLAPLSVATESSMESAAKYLRLFATASMVAIGFLSMRCFRFRPATTSLLVFVTVFVAGALWSGALEWGLFHKGMFAISCTAGLALANGPRNLEELEKGLRFLGVVVGVATLVVVFMYFRGSSEHVRWGRLAVFGTNANTIGGTAAPLLIISAHLMLFTKSRLMRWLLIFQCAVLAAMILSTGSRGSLLVSLAGGAMLALPFVKRPGVLIAASVGVIAILFVITEVVDLPGISRLGSDLAKDTRSNVWNWGMRRFSSSPLIGVGWLHYGNRWSTVQSAYLQTLVETGVIGAACLAWFLVVLLFRAKALNRVAISRGRGAAVASLALALIVAVLVRGLTESSPFVGTSVSSLFLGFSVGILDRVAEFAQGTNRKALRGRFVIVRQMPAPTGQPGRKLANQ